MRKYRRSLISQLALSAAWCFLAITVQVAGQSPNQPQNFSGPYRVAGTVVSKIDGHPLGRARLTLADVNAPQKFQAIISSDDGRFVFPSVPGGKFSLTAMKHGFNPAGYDQHDQFSTAIVTGAGLDTESLIVKLAPHGVVYGKVLDEAGEPVRAATVTLYYDDHTEGVDQIRESQTAMTNDLGAYEMASLRPGTYYVGVTAKPWYALSPPSLANGVNSSGYTDRSLDVAYPVTYYADVTDSDAATPIPLKGGEHLEVDIHLNPVPALRLRFRVPGDPQHGYSMPQFEQHSFAGSTFVNPTISLIVSPGVMEVGGIPAGRYDVHLQGPGTASQISGVDLTNRGEEIDTSAAEAFSTVKMRVEVPDLGKSAELIAGLRSQGRTGIRAGQVDPKGELELQQIPAGKYEVMLFGRGRRYSISRVSAEGAEVSGRHVTIAPGSTASISVIAVPGSVVVEGIAKRAGKPFAGAMIVLVPKDVEGNRDLFRRDQSDLDGTFSLRDVAPGSYTLVAIDDGWELDWSQPGVIAVYAKRGRALEVPNTPGKPLRVDSPIEVVSK